MTTTELDYFSDLAKDLYGTRRLADLARESYERFTATHPGESPYVWDGALVTRETFIAETTPVPLEGVTLNGCTLVFDPTTCSVVALSTSPEEAA